jgi:hypothetical protein
MYVPSDHNIDPQCKTCYEKQKQEKRLLGRNQCESQGCQIFLGTTYQNGEKYTKLPQNTPTATFARPSKIYPNFWPENMPSGNPGDSQARLSPDNLFLETKSPFKGLTVALFRFC